MEIILEKEGLISSDEERDTITSYGRDFIAYLEAKNMSIHKPVLDPGFPGWGAISLARQADSGSFRREIEPAERAWDDGRDG